jgi:hypothetical protein
VETRIHNNVKDIFNDNCNTLILKQLEIIQIFVHCERQLSMYYIFANQKIECVQVFVCILHIHIKERDTKTVWVILRKLSSQFALDLTDKRHASLNK